VPPFSISISDPSFAADITRAASTQTYYTIRFLADNNLVDDAYRAYAYFRWVDDWIDGDARPRATRLAFIHRQQALIGWRSGDAGEAETPIDLAPEERLVVDLLQREPDRPSGLQAYIQNMMSVMAFDAERRGRLITQNELDDYTRWLAVAIAEAMHYFIGHDCQAPQGEKRYLAVRGAHIAHMLRDTLADVAAGYYNIPREVLDAGGIAESDVESRAYRGWVEERVNVARACFRAGRDQMAEVESLRCRIAAYAYIHRFENLLDAIERDDYLLRAGYTERKGQGIERITWALWMALRNHRTYSSHNHQVNND